MTKNTNQSHSHCFHDNTKSARAKCRAARKIEAAETADTIASLVASYYDNSAEVEDIMAGLHAIDHNLTVNFYNNTLDADEIIAGL
jgi:hypothetical protein